MKQLTIVLFCMKNAYKYLSVRYKSTESNDIYCFGRPSLFLPYIRLLSEKHRPETTTIVIVNGKLEITLDILKGISEIIVSDQSHHEMTVPGLSSSATTAQNYQISRPKPYGLIIINDCSFETNQSVLSPKSICLQQVLRLIALNHGAAFASMSNILKLNEGIEFLETLNTIACGLPQPVLDFVKGTPKSPQIHQQIPTDWDSYSKILLIAKAAPHIEPKSCLHEESDLKKLRSLYCSWLDCTDNDSLHSFLRFYDLLDQKDDISPPTNQRQPMTFGEILNLVEIT